MRIILLVVFLMGLSGGAMSASSFMTGNKLLRDCNNANNILIANCAGYISAITDVLTTGPYRGYGACTPVGVEVGQVFSVVKIWMESHPEKLHHNAPILVAKALSEAFPCPK
jgi:hypothetical protein